MTTPTWGVTRTSLDSKNFSEIVGFYTKNKGSSGFDEFQHISHHNISGVVRSLDG